MDPLAHEHLRTIITNALWEDSVADVASEKFPEAHFEYRKNENGVRMRRVVAVTEWEVDPVAVWASGPSTADR